MGAVGAGGVFLRWKVEWQRLVLRTILLSIAHETFCLCFATHHRHPSDHSVKSDRMLIKADFMIEENPYLVGCFSPQYEFFSGQYLKVEAAADKVSLNLFTNESCLLWTALRAYPVSHLVNMKTHRVS